MGRDHVIEVTYVVTVQMGEDHTRQHEREQTLARQTQDDSPATVEKDVGRVRCHQRRGPRMIGVGNRGAGSEQRDLQ